jgi:hypothetical protein
VTRLFALRSVRAAGRVALWPVAVLLRLLRVRLVALSHPERIGHLCLEPDCFIKEGLLGLRPAFRAVVLMPRDRVANQVLVDIWRRHLTVVTSPLLCRFLALLWRFPLVRYPIDRYDVAIDETAACYDIYARWGTRAPVLSTAEAPDPERGRRVLAELGVPRDAWFVCVLARDGGYSPGDEHLHSFRNGDIDGYAAASEAITAKGG